MVKKASGSVMKIAHAKYLTSQQINIFVDENSENSSALLNMKYELLDPEMVLNVFKRIKREVNYHSYYSNINEIDFRIMG